MKKVLLFAVMLCLTFNCFAQLKEKMAEYKVVEGSIIVNGEKQAGYIKAVPTFSFNGTIIPALFELQRDITFIDKNTFETLDKVKGKYFKKYGPKDIDGFFYTDIEFMSAKYCIDPLAVGTNAIPKKLFMNVRKRYDNITFLAWYEESGNYVAANTLNEKRMVEVTARPDVAFLLKGADNAKAVSRLNVKKDISCPKIQEKMKDKMYRTERSDQENFDLVGVRYATNSNGILSLGSDENENLNALSDYIEGVCD